MKRRLELRVSEAGEATVRVERGPGGKPKRLGWDPCSQMERMLRKVENIERAGRRARGTMRRYGVHNMLRYMWTLTYEGEGKYDHADAMQDAKRLVRILRRELGVTVYMYSPEPHPGACERCGKSKCKQQGACAGAGRLPGHGWHTNLFVGSRLDHAKVEAAWERVAGGFVWVKDWGRDRTKGRSLRERVRAAAAYGAKYGAKGVEELAQFGVSMRPGQHRYEVARGRSPRWTMTRVVDELDAMKRISELGRVVRVIACDEEVGGGLWVRFLPDATGPPDEKRPRVP